MKLPTLVTHGTFDTIIAPYEGQALREFYQSRNAELSIVEYEGGHGTPLAVWRAIKKFLERVASSKHSP